MRVGGLTRGESGETIYAVPCGSNRIVHGIVTPHSPQNQPSSEVHRVSPHRSHRRGSPVSFRQLRAVLPANGPPGPTVGPFPNATEGLALGPVRREAGSQLDLDVSLERLRDWAPLLGPLGELVEFFG